MQNSDRTNITGYDAPLSSELERAEQEYLQEIKSEEGQTSRMLLITFTAVVIVFGALTIYAGMKLIDWVMP